MIATTKPQKIDFESVIGLEIHIQLATNTKMFCACKTSFGEDANTNTCPVCLGLPGSLPTANAKAVDYGTMVGLALGSEISPRSIFSRKHYFYPDLPKGYQTSQEAEPLGKGGSLEQIKIHHLHLEEDAAKLTHNQEGKLAETSAVDYNRGGTPLVEIVTEPDFRSAEEVGTWLKLLRVTIRQLGVSDANMDEGSLRCDVNISTRQKGDEKLGVKTELKNMNSFRFIERAIRAEIERQEKMLLKGETISSATLRYDPASNTISPLRSKEEAHDYRYFPDPDLLPIVITKGAIDSLREKLPELPAAKTRRFVEKVGLTEDTAKQLAYRSDLSNYFETALATAPVPSQILANWITGHLLSHIQDQDPALSKVTPSAMASLVQAVSSDEISTESGRKVLALLVQNGGSPQQIIQSQGLVKINSSQLEYLVSQALAAEPAAVQQVAAGNNKALGPIIAHVMKASSGKADGASITKLVKQKLGF